MKAALAAPIEPFSVDFQETMRRLCQVALDPHRMGYREEGGMIIDTQRTR